jgi:hypothetical protein
LALFYLPQAAQTALEEQVEAAVLAQVMQHCVGTLLHLVGREEQHLLEPPAAVVEAHPMVTAVQGGLALAAALMLLAVVVLVEMVALPPALPLKAALVVVDYLLAAMVE